MTRLVQCTLVNDLFSDPGLFIDFCFGRRALLFDLGDLTPLSPHQLFRVSHAFVSHAHMDHFVGFDRLLRVCLHRTMPLHLVGPAGFADRVEHKLKAYTLDLLGEDSCDFVITAAEFNGERFDRLCEFHARETFRQREVSSVQLPPGTLLDGPRTLLDEDEFRIDSVVLDHGTPCLAFAFEEKLRVNVWSEGLKLLRLPVGPCGSAMPNQRCGEVRRTIVKLSFATTSPFPSACSSNTHCAQRVDKRSLMWWTLPTTKRTSIGSSRWRAELISSLWRRRSSKWMPKLLHKGDISLRVRPVASRGEQAFPDLSPSTSQPATATMRTGFDARRSKPSANDGCRSWLTKR
jgi:ribonuclease BN (tRNA processing enzyme)